MAQIRLKHGELALIDDEDVALCAPYSWSRKARRKTVYVVGEIWSHSKRVKRVYLHRLVMGIHDHRRVDHRDRNGLNCRKVNLRVATAAQQMFNRGAFKKSPRCPYTGVYLEGSGMYRVMARHDGKAYFLGRYAEAVEAARVYDSFIVPLRGEWAVPNFPAVERGAPVPRVAELLNALMSTSS